MRNKLFTLLFAVMASVGMMAQPPHHHEPGHGHGPGHQHGPAPAHHIVCATPDQLSMTLQIVGNQSFDDKKLEIARLCVTIGRFCTDDLAMMATEFAFDDSRLLFLQYAYPYCTDPERYPLLQECFTFRSNYDKLIQTIYRR